MDTNIGKRLKVLEGQYAGKIGVVIKEDFERSKQTLKFEDGTEGEFPRYQAGILEWIDFKPFK